MYIYICVCVSYQCTYQYTFQYAFIHIYVCVSYQCTYQCTLQNAFQHTNIKTWHLMVACKVSEAANKPMKTVIAAKVSRSKSILGNSPHANDRSNSCSFSMLRMSRSLHKLPGPSSCLHIYTYQCTYQYTYQ